MPPLPPGPRFAPLQTFRFARDVHATITEGLQTYGDPFTFPLVVGPMVVTAHPDGIKEIFTADPDTFEAFGGELFGPLLGANSVLVMSGTRHKRERKLLMPPFHGERMRAYGRIMQEAALSRTAGWRAGDQVVIQEVVQAVTFDIILRAVFGVDEPDRIERFHLGNQDVLQAAKPPFLFFPLLRHPFVPGWRRFVAAQKHQDALLQEQIDLHRAHGPDGVDILGLMMAARDDAGEPMTDRELKDELVTMVIAGHETTTLTLAWAMFWLHRDRSCLARLLDELDTLGVEPHPDAIAKLPGLGAVCDETLRLSPVVDIVPRRVVRPFRLRGWDIQPGMGVAASITVAHRDPVVYAEPDEFRPERFLERRFGPFEYLPFGGGSRRCLGFAFAMYELRVVLGTLLAKYRLSLVSPVVPATVRRNLTLGPEGGVPMIFEGLR